jgi:hypothetical protein
MNSDASSELTEDSGDCSSSTPGVQRWRKKPGLEAT